MIKKSFAIIGLGRFGFKMVEELSKMGLDVIAIDSSKEAIERVRNIASESLILDAINKEALEKSGVREVDCVVVGIGKNMEGSILTTTLLKEIGVKEIIARAESPLHAKILRGVGADRVVFPEEDMAIRLAHAIHFHGVQEYVDIDGPWDLAELKISKENKLVGKSIMEIRNGLLEEVNVLMVEREEGKIFNHRTGQGREERENILPKDDYIIREDDILILFGRPENLEKFIEKIS